MPPPSSSVSCFCMVEPCVSRLSCCCLICSFWPLICLFCSSSTAELALISVARAFTCASFAANVSSLTPSSDSYSTIRLWFSIRTERSSASRLSRPDNSVSVSSIRLFCSAKRSSWLSISRSLDSISSRCRPRSVCCAAIVSRVSCKEASISRYSSATSSSVPPASRISGDSFSPSYTIFGLLTSNPIRSAPREVRFIMIACLSSQLSVTSSVLVRRTPFAIVLMPVFLDSATINRCTDFT